MLNHIPGQNMSMALPDSLYQDGRGFPKVNGAGYQTRAQAGHHEMLLGGFDVKEDVERDRMRPAFLGGKYVSKIQGKSEVTQYIKKTTNPQYSRRHRTIDLDNPMELRSGTDPDSAAFNV